MAVVASIVGDAVGVDLVPDMLDPTQMLDPSSMMSFMTPMGMMGQTSKTNFAPYQINTSSGSFTPMQIDNQGGAFRSYAPSTGDANSSPLEGYYTGFSNLANKAGLGTATPSAQVMADRWGGVMEDNQNFNRTNPANVYSLGAYTQAPRSVSMSLQNRERPTLAMTREYEDYQRRNAQ